MFSSFTKPFAAACERNKQPILEVLSKYANQYEGATLLELGSGTGQHAVHCAAALPKITWQPTERSEELPGLVAWVVDAELENLKDPILLDVTKKQNWDSLRSKVTDTHIAFTANTLHIVGWQDVLVMFRELGNTLTAGKDVPGRFFVYGPMNYDRSFTSEGNKKLDQWARDTYGETSGIRDVQDVIAVARSEANLYLEGDLEMPANNRMLVFSTADPTSSSETTE